MTLEQPRTDTAMSNTGEKISQAAAQRKAFAKSKVLNMLDAWETLSIFYLGLICKIVRSMRTSPDGSGVQTTIGNKIKSL